ncbi:GntR family transcriptional regulator [Asanoa sp. NPDC049573]|uniref:GntR family transcriptional regulator n=1 Tax=Asanoa sp. NPDC049573 TaxID=3155396 RepID=UPI0034430E5E
MAGESTPKYALIASTIQDRIISGRYPVRSLLPSEADLVREFGTARATVVRALEFLRLEGWLEAQQGRGRTVLGRPHTERSPAPTRVLRLLAGEDSTHVSLLRAAPVPATDRTADLLGLTTPARVIARRRLLADSGAMPPAFAIVHLPDGIAQRSAMVMNAPIGEDVVSRLSRTGHNPRRITERLTVRPATPREASLLTVHRGRCLLVATLVVLDGEGRPLVAVDAVQPADRTIVEFGHGLS